MRTTNYQQQKKVFHFFKLMPMTMMQAAVSLNIDRANICRYVSRFRKYGLIECVLIGDCPITNHKAMYLTTDHEIIKIIREERNTQKLDNNENTRNNRPY